MANLSSLTPFTTAASGLSGLILAVPQTAALFSKALSQTQGYQPQNPPPIASQAPQQQPPAFLFHYEGEQTATMKSDITDHFTEDNTALQDQIALKPVMITTHGFIGELNNVPPKALAAVKLAADKLTILGAYTPGLTVTALIAYDEAFFLYQTGANLVNSAVAAWSSLSGSGGQTVINGQNVTTQSSQNRQQTAFQLFYGYWSNRILFTIQTPWAVFQNMAIDTLIPVQDADTRMITEFQLTFKQMRFASSQLSVPTKQGRLGSQAAPLTDLGTQIPKPGPSLIDQSSINFPSIFGAR